MSESIHEKDTIKGLLQMTEYNGPADVGRMIQVSQGTGYGLDTPGFVQFTPNEAMDVAKQLFGWAFHLPESGSPNDDFHNPDGLTPDQIPEGWRLIKWYENDGRFDRIAAWTGEEFSSNQVDTVNRTCVVPEFHGDSGFLMKIHNPGGVSSIPLGYRFLYDFEVDGRFAGVAMARINEEWVSGDFIAIDNNTTYIVPTTHHPKYHFNLVFEFNDIAGLTGVMVLKLPTFQACKQAVRRLGLSHYTIKGCCGATWYRSEPNTDS